jgi:UDP-GlcNAc:undecaprenyl-phosphate/decaprenyl-phosphate GlcNAc-1-phosphate transferase
VEYLILAFFTAFLIVLLATPSLIKVAILKRLLDAPDERKNHKRMIPTIGGILIFAATLFAYALWFPTGSFTFSKNSEGFISDLQYMAETDVVKRAVNDFKYIVATSLMMFFVGVKDDIIGTAAIKKLAANILVALILVIMGDVRITGMHGLFSVFELPFWGSFFLSLFTIIVIINAFNLIDGVDGLAAGVGFIVVLAFGLWFYFAGDNVLSILSFSLAGSLLGFLVFNFNPAKLFMGDSGSLTIGLIVSFLAIRLIEFNKSSEFENIFIAEISKPIFAMTALVYPLVDTLRIFVYRIARGVSPFSPDRNHIHHKLLDLGFNHKQVVIIIYSSNVLIILLGILLRNTNQSIAFSIIAVVALILTQLPSFLLNRKRKLKVKHSKIHTPE